MRRPLAGGAPVVRLKMANGSASPADTSPDKIRPFSSDDFQQFLHTHSQLLSAPAHAVQLQPLSPLSWDTLNSQDSSLEALDAVEPERPASLIQSCLMSPLMSPPRDISDDNHVCSDEDKNSDPSDHSRSRNKNSPDVLVSVFPQAMQEREPRDLASLETENQTHCEEDLIEQLFDSGEDDGADTAAQAAALFWDEADVAWIDGHRPAPHPSRKRQIVLSRIDEGKAKAEGLDPTPSEGAVFQLPLPLGTLVCPPPFFRDFQVKLLLKVKIARQQLDFFASPNWDAGNQSQSYAFLRARSRWLSQCLDHKQTLMAFKPLSLMTQTSTAVSGATRVAIHSEFQVLAAIANHTCVNIYDLHALYKFCTINIPKEVELFSGRVDCGPSPCVNYVSWHRQSFTLAVSYGNCIVIFSGIHQTNSESLQSQLESQAYERISTKLIPFNTWKVVAVVPLAFKTSCLAWLGDCLVTSSPSRESLPRIPGMDEDDFRKFEAELTEHLMSFGSFHFWTTTFISAEKSIIVGDGNQLSKPKVFLVASELARRRTSKFHDLFQFESIGQFPDFIWNSKACLSILIESSKIKFGSDGDKPSLDFDFDLNDDDMEKNGRLLIRDLQSSPGNRFLSIWFKYEVLNIQGFKEETFTRIDALNDNLNCNVYLVFKNPKSDTVPHANRIKHETTMTNVIGYRSSQEDDPQSSLKKRSSDVTRQVARKALERDAQRRDPNTCGIRTRNCLRSGVTALFRRHGHHRARSATQEDADLPSDTSSTSSSSGDKDAPLRMRSEPSQGANASTASSLLWRQKLSSSSNVVKQSESFGRKEFVESWEVEGSFMDLRKILYDRRLAEVPSDFFCVTELAHSSPLLTYTWKEHSPAADDVFIPVCLISLDQTARIIIWEESSLERSVHFEVTCSIQLNTLSSRLAGLLGLQFSSSQLRQKNKRIPAALVSEYDLTDSPQQGRKSTATQFTRAASLTKFADEDQRDVVTKQAFLRWWNCVYRRTVEFADPLKQLCRSATAVSLVFLDGHRCRLGSPGAHIMRRYLWRQHYRQHLKSLDNHKPTHHIFQSTGHSFHAHGQDSASQLKSIGVQLDRRNAIDFLFVLLRGLSFADSCDDLVSNQSLTLIALKNLSCQPTAPSAAREFLKSQQLGIPHNIRLAAILNANIDSTTDTCDLSFSVVPSHYIAPSNISAWGEASRLQEGLILPPCSLLCLDSHGSLVTLSIKPQFFISARQPAETTPQNLPSVKGRLENSLHPDAGSHSQSHVFMVRYLTEIIRETYAPVSTVALYPSNRNLLIHPTRLQTIECATDPEEAPLLASAELFGVEGASNFQFETNAPRKSTRMIPPFRGSQIDTHHIAKNKVFHTMASDATPAHNKALALREHQSAAFWVLKSKVPELKGARSQWQTFDKLYNTVKVIVPLEIPATSSRFSSLRVPHLKSHTGECGFVPLRREIEGIGIDTIGEMIAFTKPENVHNSWADMRTAANSNFMKIQDFKNISSGSMPSSFFGKSNEETGYSYPSTPLIAVAPIPLTVIDAPFDIFLGILAPSRKLVAFALAADLNGRITMSPISLFGKEVLNSLLTAIDKNFHPNTRYEGGTKDDDISEVDSHVISLQVVNSHLSDNNPPDIYSRVRLVLHLGVVVDGIEEEQVLVTTLSVAKSEMPNTHVPVSLVFEPNGLDIYLDFSKGEYLGLSHNTPYIIPDLPPNDAQLAQPNKLTPLAALEHGTKCQLINSCVRYCGKSGWLQYDLIATFPPMEEPIIYDKIPATKTQFLQFQAASDKRTSLLCPVCAVVSFPGQPTSLQIIVPFFLGRILTAEEENAIQKQDQNECPNEASQNMEQSMESNSPGTMQDSRFFIMAMELSMRTLVVLTSNAGLYIFEFRASVASRNQRGLLLAMEQGLSGLQIVRDEISKIYEDGCPILPHFAVQRIQLSNCIERNWRSTIEILQRRQAEQIIQSVLSHSDERSKIKREISNVSTSSTSTEENKGAWFRKKSSLSNKSHSHSGSLKKLANSLRFGSRKGERDPSRIGNAENRLQRRPDTPEVLLKIGSLHFSQWFALEHYYATGSLMSFYEPAIGSLDRNPEVLLVKWPDTLNVPNPDFYNEELLIDCKVSQLAHPTTHAWRPLSCVRPIIVSQIPVDTADEETLGDVGENSYRQGPELSGYRWISKVWVPPSNTEIGEPLVHGIEWNRKRSLISKMKGGTITGLPVLVSYSSPFDIADMHVACADVPIPNSTGDLMVRARRSEPKSIYHPDMLWEWLKCGSAKVVLRILHQLLLFFEDPVALPLGAGPMGFAALLNEENSFFSALGYLLDLKKNERIAGREGITEPPKFSPPMQKGPEKAEDLFSGGIDDFALSSSSEDERSPSKKRFQATAIHGSPMRELDRNESILQESVESKTSGEVSSPELEMPQAQMATQREIEKLHSYLMAITRVLAVEKQEDEKLSAASELPSDDQAYPMGWPLALTMSFEEVDSLQGLVQFLKLSQLARIAHQRHAVASEWEWLYECLYSNSPIDGPENFIPETQFLISVARESFSKGTFNPDVAHASKISTDDLCWGLLVESQSNLLKRSIEIQSRFQKDSTQIAWTWNRLASVGAGFWIHERNALDELIQRVPKDIYSEELRVKKEQMKQGLLGTLDENKIEEMVLEQVGFWYCLTGKQGVLCAMFRKCKNDTVSTFLGSDFTSQRWKIAAVKNAWQLVSQKRYVFSLAFFILGKSGKEAIDICIRYLKDAQLAAVIARLYDIYVEPSEDENSVLHYLLTAKLIPLALETQDVSLLLFSQTLAVSRKYPRRVLLTSTIQTNKARTGYSILERGYMPAEQLATITQVEPGPSPPETNGTILGDNVVLRRYGQFANCPNILAFFFSAHSSFLRRLDFELFQSTVRSCLTALHRKQLYFGVCLLAFIYTRMPQFAECVPLTIFRKILTQWTMVVRSRAEFPISGDLYTACDPWLKVACSTEKASDVLMSLREELRCCPVLLRKFHLFVKVASNCPTLKALASGIQTWERLFEARSDFHWVQYLMPYVPLHYLASIIKASLEEGNLRLVALDRRSPRKLLLRRNICPILASQFEGGEIEWNLMASYCGSQSFGPITEKQQLNSSTLRMECFCLIINLIQKVGKILQFQFVDLSANFISAFHTIHELISTILFHPCLLEIEYLRKSPEVVWTLLLGLITCSLSLGLMTFDTLCGCLRGSLGTAESLFATEPTGFPTSTMVKGLLRIQTLWAAVLPANQTETVKADIVQSTSVTLLLTFLQMFLFPGISNSCATPRPLVPPTSLQSPPPPFSSLPPRMDSSSGQPVQESPTPPPDEDRNNIIVIDERFASRTESFESILTPDLRSQILSISSDILCVAYCESVLRFLRALHFFRHRNGQKDSPSLVSQFRWLERRLTLFTVHSYSERVEAEIVAFFSTLSTLQMTTLFQHFDRWDVVITQYLNCAHLGHLWSALDPSPKLRLFFLRGLTSHCHPCGWGVASLPPYRLSEAAPLMISAFQSLEGAAKFHLVYGRPTLPPLPAQKSQSSDVLPSPKVAVESSNSAVYCPVAMVLLNLQSPVLKGQQYHLLLPSIGAPGVASAVWTQRSFATLLSIATTRGVRELPFHSLFPQLCDPVECLSIRNKEDCFSAFGHMILSSLTGILQRSLESCRVTEGFQANRKLRPGSSSEFIVKYWRLILEPQTKRSLQKIFTEIRNSTFAEDSKSASPLSVSPHDSQYLYLAPHPFLPIVAGIIPLPSANHTQNPITPLVDLFAFDYLPSQKQPETTKSPHFIALGRLGLPSSHERGRVLISSKLRSILSAEGGRSDLSMVAQSSTSDPSAPERSATAALEHSTIAASMPCHLSATEVGDLHSIQWSPTGDLLMAASEQGWVLGWKVWTEESEALHRSRIVAPVHPLDTLNVAVSNGFPSFFFKAHAVARYALPILTDASLPIIVTSGKGLCQGLQVMSGVSNGLAGEKVPAEDSQHLIYSEDRYTLATPSMSRVCEGQYLKAISEGSETFIEIFRSIDDSTGSLCVWDLYKKSGRTLDHSALRPALLFADLAFSRSDHPTDIVFWAAQNAVIYGTRDGSIRSLNLRSGTISCLAKIKKEEPREMTQESQKLQRQRLKNQNWIRKIYLCELTNRLIVIVENCNVFVFDMAEVSVEENLEENDNNRCTPRLLREVKASLTHSMQDIPKGTVAGVVDTLGNLLINMTGKQGDVMVANYLSSVLIRPCHLIILTSNGRLVKVRL
eukprot:Gregarina_sp_Poly_1__9535@NODE_5_length_25086_cov_86_244454_g4_i0_p1_GENE_NODE_5_length_25086_cov_86_244454_g4_i0NODE_5_length_25086_cov_86_244454_g4_i0_p1_ORF_typecomplete_len4221_score623_63Rav1p_C/PF12234_8/3_2e47ANAPC4_WD40/PF12894_7/3_3e02ANAPC4_WD40/PF12894_7/0_68ANAPC4_WD40/PF12894_7/7_3e02_NODE_5_length_25086_cov_86_244454_g4_i0993422596